MGGGGTKGGGGHQADRALRMPSIIVLICNQLGQVALLTTKWCPMKVIPQVITAYTIFIIKLFFVT